MAALNLYEVPHRNGTMLVKLSAEEAEQVYGDNAKKIRPVAVTQPQPVATPPWAVDPDAPVVAEDEAGGDGGDEAAEKKAPAARNKSRSAAAKA